VLWRIKDNGDDDDDFRTSSRGKNFGVDRSMNAEESVHMR
jgi:hypothetical protein